MAKDFKKMIGGKKPENSLISGLVRGNHSKGEKYSLSLVPHDQIYSVAQPRKKFKNIEALAATMKGGKQLQPITVYPADSDGRYQIKFGERRWRASVLNDEPVWVQIVNRDEKASDTLSADALELRVQQVNENIQREELIPLELANEFGQWQTEFGLKTNQIAAHIGKSPAFVSKHLKLLEMPQAVMQLLEDEVVSYIETLNILTDIFKLDESEGMQLVELARSKGELTRTIAQQRLKILKDAAKNKSGSPDNLDTSSGSDSNPGPVLPDADDERPDAGNIQPVAGKAPSTGGEEQTGAGELPHVSDDASSLCDTHSDDGHVKPAAGNDSLAGQHAESETSHSGNESQPSSAAADNPESTDDGVSSQNTASAVPPDNSKSAVPAPAKVVFYVKIDDAVYELVDKPSVIENGEVFIFCRENKESPEMQVPISECTLHDASLTN